MSLAQYHRGDLDSLWACSCRSPAHADAPDPRFGIVETFVNPAAATEAGAGYTRIVLRWDVIQPAGPGRLEAGQRARSVHRS